MKVLRHACLALLSAASFAIVFGLLRGLAIRDDLFVCWVVSGSRVVNLQVISVLGASEIVLAVWAGPVDPPNAGEMPEKGINSPGLMASWTSSPVQPDERAALSARPFRRTFVGGVHSSLHSRRNRAGDLVTLRAWGATVPHLPSSIFFLASLLLFWWIGARRRRARAGFCVVRAGPQSTALGGD
jgi:hypothetical protein